MNVVQSSRRASTTPSKPFHDISEQSGSGRLNFYFEAPTVELSIDDFEVYALKRLKVLKKIEQLKMMRVSQEIQNQKLKDVLNEQGLQNDEIDEISHFILRLPYCLNEENRQWFLRHEVALFQYRLKSMEPKQIARDVRAYCQVKPISKEEKEEHQEALLKLCGPAEYATAKFYAVPFTQVLDLVSQRKCYLHKGQAYIPQSHVESLLASKFRVELSRTLASMGNCNTLNNANDPEMSRLTPMVKNFSKCLVTEEPGVSDVSLTGTSLRSDNIMQHVPYMPLCMRQLQTGLSKEKKLKHWGRLQYGLFLKGAGLSMEDALAFFQRQFSNLTGEQFNKEYAYNIRHMYGREGKRATYTPYSCSRITAGNAPSSTGEHHGCPYKHYDADHLRQLLQKLSVGTTNDRNEIINLKKSNQFQLACLKHFQVVHPDAANRTDVNMDNVGNHPNAWFRASVSYHKNPGGESKTEAVVTPEKQA